MILDSSVFPLSSGGTTSLRDDLKYEIEVRGAGSFLSTTTGGILASNAYIANASFLTDTTYDTPSSSNTNFGNKDWSVACLVKPNFTSSSGDIVNFLLANDRTVNQREFTLGLGRYNNALPSQPFVLSILIGNGVSSAEDYYPAYTNNIWQLIILNHTASSKNVKIYINNTLISDRNYSITLGVSSNPLSFGYRAGLGGGSCTNTLVQYLYKWDRLLTLSEREYLYNSGSFRFV